MGGSIRVTIDRPGAISAVAAVFGYKIYSWVSQRLKALPVVFTSYIRKIRSEK